MKIMDPEERFDRIERQLEFMAGMQAEIFASQQRNDAEIAQNSLQIAENSKQISEIADSVSTLAGTTSTLAGTTSTLAGTTSTLADSVSTLAGSVSTLAQIVGEQGNRMEMGFRHTDALFERTDERLNALIDLIRRNFPNGHQG